MENKDWDGTSIFIMGFVAFLILVAVGMMMGW
jgi:hypothetical protein